MSQKVFNRVIVGALALYVVVILLLVSVNPTKAQRERCHDVCLGQDAQESVTRGLNPWDHAALCTCTRSFYITDPQGDHVVERSK